MNKTINEIKNNIDENVIISNTANIVSAYVRSNAIKSDALPQLIRTVHQELSNLSVKSHVEKPTPAVSPKKSITDDYIICLENGVKLKMLKRYLKSQFNMTPQQYREKWNLSPNYPMVAPNYAKFRRMLAKKNGLGKN